MSKRNNLAKSVRILILLSVLLTGSAFRPFCIAANLFHNSKTAYKNFNTQNYFTTTNSTVTALLCAERQEFKLNLAEKKYWLNLRREFWSFIKNLRLRVVNIFHQYLQKCVGFGGYPYLSCQCLCSLMVQTFALALYFWCQLLHSQWQLLKSETKNIHTVIHVSQLAMGHFHKTL